MKQTRKRVLLGSCCHQTLLPSEGPEVLPASPWELLTPLGAKSVPQGTAAEQKIRNKIPKDLDGARERVLGGIDPKRKKSKAGL